ncbi:hypothetical protein ONS95_011677 [Cadophora gregata]|uniref:uncharacterized protein n=1 Tax=Cadophora gregata TaxID=51156 RepID=UPI0026DD6B69|nr:uncharacterized protein ONS95_011677 [Cadophora gregata]KAK0120272.1 hypothetical protein ONS95_011677 [Cadophora gregata]KAK0121306.1 hypothetical protein ONS96_011480 [Cadophora gregata f. sp. sojae]
MQFSAVLIAILAAAPGVLADLHSFAWCYDTIPAKNFKVGPSTKDRDDVTQKACARYRARNTGTKQWDTCPDCTMGINGDSSNVVCRSNGKHIGGDEWAYYCKQEGANAASAA